MNYSELNQVRKYERKDLCGCGQPARHASGKCWQCKDLETKPARDKMLKEQLIKIDMWQQEGETRDEWNKRCKEYCTSKGYKRASVG